MRFFEESMDKALQRRHTVAQDLRLALRREEFEVVCQSQFDLSTGEQTGVEALVRWHHPVHGKVAPTHFISVAEETGLIVPLGEWVLRRACSDAVTWNMPLTVAVFLSPAQFRGADVAETVAHVLRETGLPPERLELEITESLLINDTEEVFGKLNRLCLLGVKIVRMISALVIRASAISRVSPSTQDRPRVRAQHDARPGDASHRQDHHYAWQVAWRDRDRGGCRVGRSSGHAARFRLSAGARISLRPARGSRRHGHGGEGDAAQAETKRRLTLRGWAFTAGSWIASRAASA